MDNNKEINLGALKIFIIILLCSTVASGQVKCKLIENKVDEFTGRANKLTDFVVMAKAPGMIKMKSKVFRSDNSVIVWFMANKDLGCIITDKSYCTLKFEDGELLTLTYTGEIECSSVIIFSAMITSHLDKISTTAISKIRLRLETYEDMDVIEPWFLKDLVKCVGL